MRDDIYGKGRRQGRNRSSETEGDDNRFRASHVYAQCCRMSDFEYNVAAHKWPKSWRHILGLVQGGLITPVDVDERWCSCFCAATVARVACSAEGCMPLPLTKRAGRIGRIGGLAGHGLEKRWSIRWCSGTRNFAWRCSRKTSRWWWSQVVVFGQLQGLGQEGFGATEAEGDCSAMACVRHASEGPVKGQ
jgi:hypothetical protein